MSDIFIPDYIKEELHISSDTNITVNGKPIYERISAFNKVGDTAIVVVNKTVIDNMANGEIPVIFEYPCSWYSKKIDSSRVQDRLTKSNVFPIQSVWRDNLSNKIFYATTYFSEDDKFDISYISQDYVTMYNQASMKYTQYYAMCYSSDNVPGYRLGDGTNPGGFTHHDIFTANFYITYGDFYQICIYPYGVIALKPPTNEKFSPFAHSRDWFNGSYLGVIKNTDSDAMCRIINSASFWTGNNKNNKHRFTASDFKYWLATSGENPENTLDRPDSRYEALKTKTYINSGTELITYNKVQYGNKYYWICALPNESYRHLWYFVEAKDDLNWVAIVNGYSENNTPNNDFPNNDVTSPNESYQEEKHSDIVGDFEKTEDGLAIGGAPTRKEADTSKKYGTENPNKFYEKWYETKLNPGDTDWEFPGIIKDVDKKFIETNEVWNDASDILHDAMRYEDKEWAPLYTWYDERHLNRINRFRLLPTNSGLSTKSFIFMTRPDLHLYDEDETTGVINSYAMNPDLKRLPTFKYIARLKGLQSIMGSLQYSTRVPSNNTPWLSVISNQATGYSPINREMDTTEIGETFHGNKIIYIEPTFNHKIAGRVTIPFRERRDLSLYYTLKMWIEYMQAVTLGKCSPRRKHIIDMTLDYAVSLYFIQTDETMENILYWEKLVGVIPLSVPDSFFEWDEKSPGKNMEYSIEFAYSMRVVQDEMSLYEINNLYSFSDLRNGALVNYDGYSTSHISDYDRLLATVADSFGTFDNDGTGYPEKFAKTNPTYMDKTIKDSESMRRFYYANKAQFGIFEPGSHGYKVQVQDSSGNISYVTKDFLPNYIPDIGMHGTPYVTGPFITKELDRMEQKDFHGVVTEFKTYTGTPIDNGIYKLRWV